MAHARPGPPRANRRCRRSETAETPGPRPLRRPRDGPRVRRLGRRFALHSVLAFGRSVGRSRLRSAIDHRSGTPRFPDRSRSCYSRQHCRRHRSIRPRPAAVHHDRGRCHAGGRCSAAAPVRQSRPLLRLSGIACPPDRSGVAAASTSTRHRYQTGRDARSLSAGCRRFARRPSVPVPGRSR